MAVHLVLQGAIVLVVTNHLVLGHGGKYDQDLSTYHADVVGVGFGGVCHEWRIQ